MRAFLSSIFVPRAIIAPTAPLDGVHFIFSGLRLQRFLELVADDLTRSGARNFGNQMYGVRNLVG